MANRIKRLGLFGVALAAGIAMAGLAQAQEWPQRPVTVIVPFASGGGSDGIVRLVQRYAGERGWLARPLVVQNVGGAGGRTGSRQAMAAAPDGYTFLTNHLTLMTAEATGAANFGYRDFTPVAATGAVCMVVAVPAASPHRTLADLLAASARAPIVYGANLGALNHMAGLTVQNTFPGAQFRFVQIGGDTENFVALSGGVIPAGGMSTQQYRSGQGGGVRALAVLSAERDPALPDVPTAREQGFDAEFCFEYWWFAPRGTPAAVIESMANMLQTAMADEALLRDLTARAIQPVFRRGEAFRAFLDQRWEFVQVLARQAQQ